LVVPRSQHWPPASLKDHTNTDLRGGPPLSKVSSLSCILFLLLFIFEFVIY
jgi:hypothetical protein